MEKGPIYHLINAEEIRGRPAWLSLAGQLLDIKEFQGWHVPPETVQKYREEVRHAAESLIIVSPTLQQERVEDVQKRALRKCRSRYLRTLSHTSGGDGLPAVADETAR